MIRAGHPADACPIRFVINAHSVGGFVGFTQNLQQIQEEGDHGGVDDIGEHRANDGDDEEGLDGIAGSCRCGGCSCRCMNGCAKILRKQEGS